MKKTLSIILSVVMLLTSLLFPVSAFSKTAPIADCTFDDSSVTKPKLYGNANVVFDEVKNSYTLVLDGSSGTYAELEPGFLNGTVKATVSFDVFPGNNSGNYFTFGIGLDSDKYTFLKISGNSIRNAITTGSYMNERAVSGTLPYNNGWLNVAIVFDGLTMSLYVNGKLLDRNSNTEIELPDLGNDLKIYLGKSFYGGDGYFSGKFDNVKIYKDALTEQEIKEDITLNLPLLYSATLGSVLPDVSASTGTDNHTAVYTNIDRDKGEINSYVKPSQNLKSVPLSLNLRESDTEVKINSASVSAPYTVDLTSAKTLTLTSESETVTYKINTPKTAYNPVLPGQYADPDIDILDGRFWIFPTTDGVEGWAGTQFHAFSSLDLVNWIDEGVILDTKDKTSKNNALGVKIATSKWSDGNAWAPAIEAKGGKYYFYYCGAIANEYTSLYGNGMAIGVATASTPNGPYTAADAPILYPKMMEDSGIGFSGQVIDPSIFTDDDGSSYILFGNGMAAMAKLNSNMTSVNTSTLQIIYGLNDFRESIAIFKRGGYYYYTWSCDDTGSENYHINYGYNKMLGNDVTFKGTILEKNTSLGILGTGHQSVLYIPETDKCFIAYHRFYTPLNQVGGGFGFHRETCIDEITFSEKLLADEINKVNPSFEGTGAYNTKGAKISPVTPTHYTYKAPTVTPSQPATQKTTTAKKITVARANIKAVKKGKKSFKVTWKKIKGVTGYQVQFSTSKKFTKKTTKTKTLKGASKYALTVKKLKSKKTYYIRLRAYKKAKVNGKNKTYYGKWSKVKYVKTK